MLIAPIEDAGNRQFDELRRASLAMYPTLIREVQRLSGIDVEYKRQGMIRTARTEDFARKLKSLARRREGWSGWTATSCASWSRRSIRRSWARRTARRTPT